MSGYEPEMAWPDRYARNVRIVQLFADGVTCREIAEREDMSHVAVMQILRSAGIDTSANRGRPTARQRRNAQRDQEIAKAYAIGKSLADLGRRYQLSRQRVEQIVRNASQRQGTENTGEKA